MSSIGSFKAQLINGGFRPNQFQVVLTFPSIIPGGALAGQKTQFLAKSASLPASTVEAITTSFRGRQVHFAGERTFQPWTISVYTDTDFGVRNTFESWLNTIQQPAATNGAVQPAVYQTDIQVIALDRNDNQMKTYTLRDAFPTEIGAIGLDWETNNQIGSFDVTFEYNYFESITGTGVVVA